MLTPVASALVFGQTAGERCCSPILLSFLRVLRSVQTSHTIAYQIAATRAHANPRFQSGACDSTTAVSVRAMPRLVKIPVAAPRNAHTIAAIA